MSTYSEKAKRRDSGKAPDPHQAVATGEFVPATLLESTRERLGGELERRTRALRQARRTEDELVRVLTEIRRMTDPATVQNYAGGHRAHVAAVNAKAKAALAKIGSTVVATPAEPPR